MIVSTFQPVHEASFWVVRCVVDGMEYFHPQVFFHQAAADVLVSRVREAGAIDPARWKLDYPRSDMELK